MRKLLIVALLLAGCGGGIAPNADQPPAGAIWFGSTFDASTFAVRGRTSAVMQGQQVAMVGQFTRTVPQGTPISVKVTFPDGTSAPIGNQTFDFDASLYGVVLPSALFTLPGRYAFEIDDVGGNSLASGGLQVNP